MEPIQIQIILEVLGRPAENVQQALASVVTKLANEKGVKVLERKFHDSKSVPEANDLYTAFAEVTLEINSLENYFTILFSYMPSHVELIYPEKITLDNAGLNHFANQLIQRLHQYDAVVKNVLAERNIMLRKIQQEAPHLLPHLQHQQAEQLPTNAQASSSSTKKSKVVKKKKEDKLSS